MPDEPGPGSPGSRRGWQLLGAFWVAVGGTLLAGVAVLAALGPPRPVVTIVARHEPAPPATTRATARPALSTADADPALLIESGNFPGRMLPRVAMDGRRSSRVYAAAVPRVLPGQARLALVLDGIGLDRAASLDAIATLPAPVTLAVSPYAEDLAPLVAAARRRGHEVLVSLPMEPENSAEDDEGDRALTPDADLAANGRNLEWALSAANAIVGATAADPSGNGEHVTSAITVFRHTVAETLAADGLLYVATADAAPPAVPGLPVARADLSIDARPAPDALDGKLESLAADAVRNGTALGTLGPPLPSTEARLAAFLRTLPARGIVLVPASALASDTPSEDASR